MSVENGIRQSKNVFGEVLMACSTSPMTGYYRNGCCDTGPDDRGLHTVCVVMTEEFLAFTKLAGNDLSTAIPEYQFPGLKPGDHWCLCVTRWVEAYEAGVAPKIKLAATHEHALEYITMDQLKEHEWIQ